MQARRWLVELGRSISTYSPNVPCASSCVMTPSASARTTVCSSHVGCSDGISIGSCFRIAEPVIAHLVGPPGHRRCQGRARDPR